MVASVLEEAPSVFGTNRRQCYAYRFYQSLFRSGSGLAEQVLDLGEGLFYGVSMRRFILSRANVVASGDSVVPKHPFALRFHTHSVWAGYEWPGARWDPSGAALPFEVRPPANGGGHTPSRSRREQA